MAFWHKIPQHVYLCTYCTYRSVILKNELGERWPTNLRAYSSEDRSKVASADRYDNARPIFAWDAFQFAYHILYRYYSR